MSIKRAYLDHKKGAAKRGISFLLTFGEWLEIWEKSGYLHKRGRHKGQYVMARFGDKGPYAPWNVKIILSEDNAFQAQIGRKHGQKTRKKMSLAKIGCKLSLEHCQNISNGLLGNKNAVGTRPSEETRAKLRAALARRRAITDETKASA